MRTDPPVSERETRKVRAEGYHRARSAGRASGDRVRVPRITTVAPSRVVSGDTERKLRHVACAELDRARHLQTLQHRGAPQGRNGLEGFGAEGRGIPGTIEHVLVRHRDTKQRSEWLAALSSRLIQQCVYEFRGAQRPLFLEA